MNIEMNTANFFSSKENIYDTVTETFVIAVIAAKTIVGPFCSY